MCLFFWFFLIPVARHLTGFVSEDPKKDGSVRILSQNQPPPPTPPDFKSNVVTVYYQQQLETFLKDINVDSTLLDLL